MPAAGRTEHWRIREARLMLAETAPRYSKFPARLTILEFSGAPLLARPLQRGVRRPRCHRGHSTTFAGATVVAMSQTEKSSIANQAWSSPCRDALSEARAMSSRG